MLLLALASKQVGDLLRGGPKAGGRGLRGPHLEAEALAERLELYIHS